MDSARAIHGWLDGPCEEWTDRPPARVAARRRARTPSGTFGIAEVRAALTIVSSAERLFSGFPTKSRAARAAPFAILPPAVESLLVEAQVELRRRFDGAHFWLAADLDPNSDAIATRAVLTVAVALPVDDALRRLAAFDDEWWFEARERAAGELEVAIAFI